MKEALSQPPGLYLQYYLQSCGEMPDYLLTPSQALQSDVEASLILR